MSEIKDKKIRIYNVEADRDLWQNERKVKRYIHDRNGLWAYARELSEREKFAAKAAGSEQSIVFKINYNNRVKAGLHLEFGGDTFVIKSVDGFEYYKHDLTLRAERVKAEVCDHDEYDEAH